MFASGAGPKAFGRDAEACTAPLVATRHDPASGRERGEDRCWPSQAQFPGGQRDDSVAAVEDLAPVSAGPHETCRVSVGLKSTLRVHQMAPPGQPRTKLPR